MSDHSLLIPVHTKKKDRKNDDVPLLVFLLVLKRISSFNGLDIQENDEEEKCEFIYR